jgi:hypothetical protein
MPRKKKVVTFTRPECQRVRAEVQAVLEKLGEQLGLDVSLGNGRFNEEAFSMKLEFTAPDKDGNRQSRNEQEFKMYAKSFGLEPDDFGKTFVDRNHSFVITGIKPRSYKFPILVTRDDGKKYKYPVDDVIRGLGRKTSVNSDSPLAQFEIS